MLPDLWLESWSPFRVWRLTTSQAIGFRYLPIRASSWANLNRISVWSFASQNFSNSHHDGRQSNCWRGIQSKETKWTRRRRVGARPNSIRLKGRDHEEFRQQTITVSYETARCWLATMFSGSLMNSFRRSRNSTLT
jgi:hypothetical protein